MSSYWRQLENKQRLFERHDMVDTPDSFELLEEIDVVSDRIAALEHALGLQSYRTRRSWQVVRNDTC